MTAGIVRIVRKLPSSPNTSGRGTLTKKARAAGVRSITLNERRWEFQSDIRTFRSARVFCLKGPMGRSRVDRVKAGESQVPDLIPQKFRRPSKIASFKTEH
ncbi:hypothetical protein AVEN_40407-1 [Araneus ventricosus]|uniref:Uncharacterized protein n=1 Tax=Araneus ventricosus TaxID=182803 RepID=A0A4Y2DBH8_ARAVE|nr:hypothetical protein AVEN_40407-1 [Araneus ventricosus]